MGGTGTPFTAGDVTQESLGFSAAVLVFSQPVRARGEKVGKPVCVHKFARLLSSFPV